MSAIGGSCADSAGSVRALGASEVEVEELARWRSPESGRIYPARWRITVPGPGLDLRVEPLLADQEHRHSFLYWEGAVAITGEGPGGAFDRPRVCRTDGVLGKS